jgi:hypothetical protein
LNASAFLLTFRQNAESSAGISTSIVSVSKSLQLVFSLHSFRRHITKIANDIEDRKRF